MIATREHVCTAELITRDPRRRQGEPTSAMRVCDSNHQFTTVRLGLDRPHPCQNTHVDPDLHLSPPRDNAIGYLMSGSVILLDKFVLQNRRDPRGSNDGMCCSTSPSPRAFPAMAMEMLDECQQVMIGGLPRSKGRS
jgi:hypothetical protein